VQSRIHGRSADERAEEGLCGRKVSSRADALVDIGQFALEGHEDVDRVRETGIDGDDIDEALGDFLHGSGFVVVWQAGVRPSPEVHEENSAPPVGHLATGVLDGQADLAEVKVLDDHAAELERCARLLGLVYDLGFLDADVTETHS